MWREEKSYFPDSLSRGVTSVSPLKQVQRVWNNVFPNCTRHQSWEESDDNKRRKAMRKSSFLGYSAHTNLSGRVFGGPVLSASGNDTPSGSTPFGNGPKLHSRKVQRFLLRADTDKLQTLEIITVPDINCNTAVTLQSEPF